MLARLEALAASTTFKRLTVDLRSDGRFGWGYANPDGSYAVGTGDTISDVITGIVTSIEAHRLHEYRKPRLRGVGVPNDGGAGSQVGTDRLAKISVVPVSGDLFADDPLGDLI